MFCSALQVLDKEYFLLGIVSMCGTQAAHVLAPARIEVWGFAGSFLV